MVCELCNIWEIIESDSKIKLGILRSVSKEFFSAGADLKELIPLLTGDLEPKSKNESDLLKEGSYNDAMVGCQIVIHTASPFLLETKNPQKDLIDPALKGTINVLNSVNETSTVTRVVLTSSVAAIYGDAIDSLGYPNRTLDESIWNTSSSLKNSEYSYSKTLAEKKHGRCKNYKKDGI